MRYRTLGRTGLRVSVIGLGTWQFGGEWGRTFSQADVDAILDKAAELGINLLDTAECYGDHLSEGLIGDYLSRRDRSRWLVATKFGHHYNRYLDRTEEFSVADVRRQLAASLRALRVETIDLYQFHSGSDTQFLNEDYGRCSPKRSARAKSGIWGSRFPAKAANCRRAKRGASARRPCKSSTIASIAGPSALHFPHARQDNLGVLARVPWPAVS